MEAVSFVKYRYNIRCLVVMFGDFGRLCFVDVITGAGCIFVRGSVEDGKLLLHQNIDEIYFLFFIIYGKGIF